MQQRKPGLFNDALAQPSFAEMVERRSLVTELTKKAPEERLSWLSSVKRYFREIYTPRESLEIFDVLDLLLQKERLSFLNMLPPSYIMEHFLGDSHGPSAEGLGNIQLTKFRLLLLRLPPVITEEIDPILKSCVNETKHFLTALAIHLQASQDHHFYWLQRALMPAYIRYQFNPDEIQSLNDLKDHIYDARSDKIIELMGDRLPTIITTAADLDEIGKLGKGTLSQLVASLPIEHLVKLTTEFRGLSAKLRAPRDFLNRIPLKALAATIKNTADLFFYAGNLTSDRLKILLNHELVITKLCTLPWISRTQEDYSFEEQPQKIISSLEPVEHKVAFFYSQILPHINECLKRDLIRTFPDTVREEMILALPDDCLKKLGSSFLKLYSLAAYKRMVAATVPAEFSGSNHIEGFLTNLSTDDCHAWVRQVGLEALINARIYPFFHRDLLRGAVELGLRFFPRDMVLPLLFNENTQYKYEQDAEKYFPHILQIVPESMQADFLKEFNRHVLQKSRQFKFMPGEKMKWSNEKRGWSILVASCVLDEIVLAIHNPALRYTFLMEAIDAGLCKQQLSARQLSNIELALGEKAQEIVAKMPEVELAETQLHTQPAMR